jgi:glycosyltransferase involved in cell wall biosynthesis
VSAPLHVGIDALQWVPDASGVGTYARELIRALHAAEPGTELTVWVGARAAADLEQRDWGGPTTFVRLPVDTTGRPYHVLYELGGLGLAARRRGCDVVHGLAYATPVLAPGVGTVVTILDLTWHHHPESAIPAARVMFRGLSRICGRSADRVIAISQAVADDLEQTLGIPPDKIDVTPLGVADALLAKATPADELRARFGIPAGAPVLLCVAQIATHKNLRVLLDALPDEAWLVLPGRPTAHGAELEAHAAALGVGDRLVLPGFVSDADLEGLWATATAFVLPSLSEGFGLPVAEAMRRGVPVACSDASSLPEVAGGAALLFDPRSADAVREAIARLLGDAGLRERLAAAGRVRAAELTWEQTARATFASYRRALG